MEFVFINLDRATERRAAFEAGFAAAAAGRASILRFSGVDGDGGAPGRCSAGEKGCFLSHRGVLESGSGPLMVFEDDAVPSPRLFEVLPHFLQTDWDLVLTDVGMGTGQDFIDMARAREQHRSGTFSLFDLAPRLFFGSSGYFISGAGRGKLLSAMAAELGIDLPFDLFVRRLARQGELNAAVCVPHLTTTRPSESQIRSSDTRRKERFIQTMRDLLFVDRDLASCRVEVSKLYSESDEFAQLYGSLLAARISADWID